VTVSVESDRFASELRRWRSRRNWSQLDLAIRADTTQRHLSFLEQGRSRPGRAMVVRLAESLGLSLRERNELLLAAGFAPVYSESRLDGPELGPVRDALDRILDGHMPYPAVVVRPYGELVAANPAFAVLTEGAAPELLQPPVNVLRLATPAGLRRGSRTWPSGAGTSPAACATSCGEAPTRASRGSSPSWTATCRRWTSRPTTSGSPCRYGCGCPRGCCA
jgi:transcriptional regulator with XRE-family HTH domain